MRISAPTLVFLSPFYISSVTALPIIPSAEIPSTDVAALVPRATYSVISIWGDDTEPPLAGDPPQESAPHDSDDDDTLMSVIQVQTVTVTAEPTLTPTPASTSSLDQGITMVTIATTILSTTSTPMALSTPFASSSSLSPYPVSASTTSSSVSGLNYITYPSSSTQTTPTTSVVADMSANKSEYPTTRTHDLAYNPLPTGWSSSSMLVPALQNGTIPSHDPKPSSR